MLVSLSGSLPIFRKISNENALVYIGELREHFAYLVGAAKHSLNATDVFICGEIYQNLF